MNCERQNEKQRDFKCGLKMWAKVLIKNKNEKPHPSMGAQHSVT
jgi:hypothetical protein